MKREWRGLVDAYFGSRDSLAGLFLTVDIRRGLAEGDIQMIGWALDLECPVAVLMTKSDKLSRGAGMSYVLKAQGQLGSDVTVIRFSARTGRVSTKQDSACWSGLAPDRSRGRGERIAGCRCRQSLVSFVPVRARVCVDAQRNLELGSLLHDADGWASASAAASVGTSSTSSSCTCMIRRPGSEPAASCRGDLEHCHLDDVGCRSLHRRIDGAAFGVLTPGRIAGIDIGQVETPAKTVLTNPCSRGELAAFGPCRPSRPGSARSTDRRIPALRDGLCRAAWPDRKPTSP